MQYVVMFMWMMLTTLQVKQIKTGYNVQITTAGYGAMDCLKKEAGGLFVVCALIF